VEWMDGKLVTQDKYEHDAEMTTTDFVALRQLIERANDEVAQPQRYPPIGQGSSQSGPKVSLSLLASKDSKTLSALTARAGAESEPARAEALVMARLSSGAKKPGAVQELSRSRANLSRYQH
jgi:hypothetical protein